MVALIGAGAVIIAAIIGVSFEIAKTLLTNRPDLRGSCQVRPAPEITSDGITNIQFTEDIGKGSASAIALACALANVGNGEARDVVVTFVGEDRRGSRHTWSWDLSSIASHDVQRFALIDSRSYDVKDIGPRYVVFPNPKTGDGAAIFWRDAPYALMFP
jgi:hypothetical protein